ncbi:MAG: hypothetical protein [Caudoviricetes sp.]|nr:MAG: hypothetical protein [Caudoviricetes sp.]
MSLKLRIRLLVFLWKYFKEGFVMANYKITLENCKSDIIRIFEDIEKRNQRDTVYIGYRNHTIYHILPGEKIKSPKHLSVCIFFGWIDRMLDFYRDSIVNPESISIASELRKKLLEYKLNLPGAWIKEIEKYF